MIDKVIDVLQELHCNTHKVKVTSPDSTVKLIEANADLFRAIKKYKELKLIEENNQI